MLHLCARREGYFCVTSCCIGGEGWCAVCGASSVMGKGCKLEMAGKRGLSTGVVSSSFCRCVHPFTLWPLMPTAEKGQEWNKKIFPDTYKTSACVSSLYYIYPQDQFFLNAEPRSHVDPKRGIADNLICRKCWFLHIHSAVIFLFPCFRTPIGQELNKQNKVIPSEQTLVKFGKKKEISSLQVSELGNIKTEVF